MQFLKNYKVNIIPLGQTDMPLKILTRWGIIPSKLPFGTYFPFDTASFGIPEITKSINTDFGVFFDNLEYNGKYWIKAPNCIEFFNDKNFKKNDKDKLIKQYQKRIENFRKIVAEETPIVFVQILGDNHDIDNQYASLLKLRGKNPFKFVIVDTQNIVWKADYDDIELVRAVYPDEEYKRNWWKKEYYNSVRGKIFEEQIASACKKAITELIKAN